MSFLRLNGALSTCPAGRALGASSLALATGDGSKFGAPTVDEPLRVQTGPAGGAAVGFFRATGRTGDVLIGIVVEPGHGDVAVAPGSVVSGSDLIAEDVREIDSALAGLAASIAAIPAGPKGEDGADGKDGAGGAQGDPGTAATITVGTVTTGLPGTSAGVTNTGTDSAAVLDFVIPQGEKGDPGTPGADGADGSDGAKGEQGDPGPNTVTGLIATPTDGSVILTGSGTAADPYKPRAVPEVLIGRWRTPTTAAASTGDMDQGDAAPAALSSLRVVVTALANPAGATGGASVQLKIGGTTALASALSLPAGSLGPVEASVPGVTPAAKGAMILPALTGSVGGDVRGLLVTVWGRYA